MRGARLLHGERLSVAGRFLCAARHPNVRDVVDQYAGKLPELNLRTKEDVCLLVLVLRFLVSGLLFSIDYFMASSN